MLFEGTGISTYFSDAEAGKIRKFSSGFKSTDCS